MSPVKITQGIVEELKSKLDIVNIIGERVPLKKSGANYKGLCPFHQEKTPSFMVNPDKQIFRCFGCNIGGDVISFVEKIEGLSFYEAVVKLAENAGIKLPETHVSEYARQAQDKRQIMVELNTIARDFYAQKLRTAGNKALTYARERGLSDQTIKDFYIGYSGEAWDELAVELNKKGKSLSMAADLGLIKEKNGKYYDTFRDRLMFPILNHRSETIAFGGRLLVKSEDSPKYLNSKESELYKKGEALYGLYLTGKHIRDTGFAIVVEGYMDFISLYQAGIKNVAATLGTAFTEKQVNILKRYTDRAVLFFDSDEAGINAAKRSLPILLENGFKTDALIIDGVKDPDDAVRLLGKDKLEKMLKNAKPLISRLITEKFSTSKNINDMPKNISEVLSYIGLIRDNVSRTFWLNELSVISRMNKRELENLLRGYIKPKSTPQNSAYGTYGTAENHNVQKINKFVKAGKVPPLYKSTLRVLFVKPELCQIVFDEGWDAFIPQDLVELLYRVKNIYEEKNTVTIEDWFFTAKQGGLLWLEEFVTKESFGKKGLNGMDADKEFQGCMVKFKLNTLEEKRQESLRKIKDGETQENTLREYKAIVKEMNQLKGQERA